MACIALLTDFGLADPYAGQLKAVLAALAPGTDVVDISHGVPAFDVRTAGLFAAASAPWLPAAAVLLAVVDPGVGTARRLVCLSWRGRWLLGPDNGLFGLLLPDVDRAWELSGLPGRTFHGRDVLAPLAARLALGEGPGDFGRPLDPAALVRLEWSAPQDAVGGLQATVLHVDRFGNCLLNLSVETFGQRFAPGTAHRLRLGGLTLPLAAAGCYGELREGDVGLVHGSQGFLELAVDQGSAAVRLGLAAGDAVLLARELP